MLTEAWNDTPRPTSINLECWRRDGEYENDPCVWGSGPVRITELVALLVATPSKGIGSRKVNRYGFHSAQRHGVGESESILDSRRLSAHTPEYFEQPYSKY